MLISSFEARVMSNLAIDFLSFYDFAESEKAMVTQQTTAIIMKKIKNSYRNEKDEIQKERRGMQIREAFLHPTLNYDSCLFLTIWSFLIAATKSLFAICFWIAIIE